MDRIANTGLRYSRFHTTALSSATRAALLTGRNHHSVGTGDAWIPRGTPENRPMRDASKPANGIEAGQKHLYPTADSGDKKKVHIRRILAWSRPAGGTREPEAETVWPLHLPPFPSHRAVLGTDRSGQGRAVIARRRRIFCGSEKILRSGPLTARTVLEHGLEGKGGGG